MDNSIIAFTIFHSLFFFNVLYSYFACPPNWLQLIFLHFKSPYEELGMLLGPKKMSRMELHSHCRKKHDLKSVTVADNAYSLKLLSMNVHDLSTHCRVSCIKNRGAWCWHWHSRVGRSSMHHHCWVVRVSRNVRMHGGPMTQLSRMGGHLGLGITWLSHTHTHWTTPGYILPWHTLQPCRNSKEKKTKKKILWKSNSVVLTLLWKPAALWPRALGHTLSIHTEEVKMRAV